MSLETELADGLQAFAAQQQQMQPSFSVDVFAVEDAFLNYLRLLQHWNKAFNLTAIRDDRGQVIRHLLDSLVILPFVLGNQVVDVGTGAGLPGIPLAICLPNQRFVLVDSNSKKTRFLTQAKVALGLKNLTVIHDRVEAMPARGFDQVLCRAFKPLESLVPAIKHLLKKDGVILAMLGKSPETEVLNQLDLQATTRLWPLSVPGLQEDRFLIEIRPRPECL
ncbi:MAG: 16S rRNA (guanine(527)-N(7))-methyltransferase RsmG [Pseudomonadales bacterium]|nr:16S rRNA (guanine(527)-N(7))-methyltransferase RsmG [Pseudomonadales bacterium]